MSAFRCLCVLGLLSSILVAGCIGGSGSCSAAQSYSGQQAVCNHKDSFSYAYQAAGYSKSESYTWQNSMSKAMVSFGGQLASGSFSVVIKDAAGTQVFTKQVSGTGQGGQASTTSAGKAGAWTIQLSMSSVTGQVGLSVTASG